MQPAGDAPFPAWPKTAAWCWSAAPVDSPRPSVGVLRYTAQLSTETAAIALVSKLRTQLTDALSAGTEVRLVIETVATEKTAGRIHVRPDLPGKVATFDGDAYVVDFARPPPPPPPAKNRRR
jgi:hypothetical protein